MTEIRYYPLVDRDTEGIEKVALFPTMNRTSIMAQSKLWLEETVPCYFRLHSKNSYYPTDTIRIRCPRCGKALRRISENINETKHGLYECRACSKK